MPTLFHYSLQPIKSIFTTRTQPSRSRIETMSTLTVHVKWQKQKFSDVPVDTSQPPVLFKATLYSLSGVPPDRQKVMVKGSVLSDDSWSGVSLKPGATVMLMGSAEALPEAPAAPPVKFVEDMDESELARAMDVPPGLNNLGNTCYMNATVQCLRSVPELRSILSKNRLASLGASGGSGPEVLVSALATLFAALDKAGDAVSPHVFLHLLHAAFPQFATKAEGGVFQQQDANECWVELVRCLQSRLPVSESASSSNVSFTDRYLTGSMTCRLTCEEGEAEEPEVTTVETFTQLSCFIDKDVKYLHTGLINAMKSTLTKRSERLGRDAVYTKHSKITRLPAYLTVQFVRFYYKEKEQVNAKVLKDVKFSLTLDVYQLCSEELQARLTPAREQIRRMDEWLSLRSGANKRRTGGPPVADSSSAAAATTDTGTNNASWPPSLPPLDPEAPPPPAYYFEDDPGSNASGQYMLQAVLTHQGRSSSSGHYVAWVRKADQPANANPEEDVWFKFDDDYVSPVTGADILRLSGGGDWHCAYLLLYGPRRLDRDYSALPPPTESTQSSSAAN